ncbi:MAG: hypothetical protein ACFBRM_07120 [Pikeienuella sp.]
MSEAALKVPRSLHARVITRDAGSTVMRTAFSRLAAVIRNALMTEGAVPDRGLAGAACAMS